MYEMDLYTDKYLTSVSYDLLHEWEEDFVKYMNVDMVDLYHGVIGGKKRSLIIFANKGKRFLGIDKARFKTIPDSFWHILFIPNASVYLNYTHIPNIIPLFLDFPNYMVEKVKYATEKLPVYFVTAYDIYERLKNAGSNNVEYIPTGISDSYVKAHAPQKTINVVQFGRKNVKLHEWMLEYCKSHPDVEYVYVKNADFEYYSTTRGDIGTYNTREEFCGLIDSAQIALVSSPGAEGVSRFGDIDFITPRFYECIAHYCFVIGRYTANRETEIIGLSDVCPNVNSQEEFNRYVKDYLSQNTEDNVLRYRDFLERNVMSRRAETVKSIVDKALL